ncbi:hypothetical protein LCGC14_0237380 [marine sediment metagenome]|jgi:hypothetical protein|uniref:Uncharacterized protein n=1 Tax=marine sediment metagenome TaxID=412755 RepID=A0A0F9WTI3_9ZZZZ|nr:hypothetical protein [uncultured Halomonas sp.]|tara:strand:- start:16955 stop:17659 length:705 start_codon:yes stop_codon:yes gene_type:complete
MHPTLQDFTQSLMSYPLEVDLVESNPQAFSFKAIVRTGDLKGDVSYAAGRCTGPTWLREVIGQRLVSNSCSGRILDCENQYELLLALADLKIATEAAVVLLEKAVSVISGARLVVVRPGPSLLLEKPAPGCGLDAGLHMVTNPNAAVLNGNTPHRIARMILAYSELKPDYLAKIDGSCLGGQLLSHVYLKLVESSQSLPSPALNAGNKIRSHFAETRTVFPQLTSRQQYESSYS